MKIKDGWSHNGSIQSKRNTSYAFIKDDTIRDNATGEVLDKVFLVVEHTNCLLRGNENDRTDFYNRRSTPKCFVKYWKEYDVFKIKKSMERMGLTLKDLKNGKA